MPRYVALFRGINVGKAKRIAMADLRALLGKLGYEQVQTLLNSGNAVFTSAAEPAGVHAERIREAVKKKLGVDALVILKSDKDVAGMIKECSLIKVADDPSRLLVAMTNDAKALGSLKSLSASRWEGEQVQLGKHAAFVWCGNGILESKALGVVLTALGGTGTTRNWATLGKIQALMEQDPDA